MQISFVTSNQELYTHAPYLLGHMTDDGGDGGILLTFTAKVW